MSAEQYVGSELELFSAAHRWKGYFSDLIRPHLGVNVLEVGAGLGGTTKILTRGFSGSWACLEPDAGLAGNIGRAIDAGELPATCRVVTGTLATFSEQERFDSILYIDVLEHIENDAAEAALAASRLIPGGRPNRALSRVSMALQSVRPSHRPLPTLLEEHSPRCDPSVTSTGTVLVPRFGRLARVRRQSLRDSCLQSDASAGRTLGSRDGPALANPGSARGSFVWKIRFRGMAKTGALERRRLFQLASACLGKREPDHAERE